MNGTIVYTRKIRALYGYEKALYFFISAQLNRNVFVRWLNFIETTLPEGIPDVFRVRLAMRAAFRFINPQFSISDRIEVLVNHYSALIKRFSIDALSKFLGGTGYEIAEMTGQSGKKYVIRIISDVSKEGTLTIVFMDTEANVTLALLTGSISLDGNDRPVFWVGMLRGPGGRIPNGKKLVVDVTRDLNGLRPKQAVVHAASALAQWFNAKEIIAPSTSSQIAIKNLFKGHKIHADHDAFWQEFTKEPATEGAYHLHLPLQRRDLADVQQKRRKDWVLRYERIDAVAAKIKDALDGLAVTG